jgi:hypothetical protein
VQVTFSRLGDDGNRMVHRLRGEKTWHASKHENDERSQALPPWRRKPIDTLAQLTP